MSKRWWALLCIGLTSSTLADVWSPGGWPTLHFDNGNRRMAKTRVTELNYTTWTALAGATVLTAPTLSPDGQTLYVTTALGEGQSNLYAFAIDGQERWRSEPWSGPTKGLDPCAILSSPLIDAQGDIYIGDCNQLFAYKPNGDIKWVIDLPALQAGDWKAVADHPINALTTAMFSADGDVVGVTNFGDVLVIDRVSGEQRNQPWRLPSLIAPYSNVIPMPDSMFAGMMDERFKEWAWQLLFGGSMRSANTPAAGRDNRLYVVGSSQNEGLGALYGLDLIDDEQGLRVELAWTTDIGLGSGSSPALSPDEQQVYVSDEEGLLYGISSVDGTILWQTQTHAAAGAAGVGPDGTIYALQAFAPAVVAVSPAGEQLWQSDISALEAAYPAHWLLGQPVSVGNGNPTITANAILVPVLYAYAVTLTERPINFGFKSTVVALDINTGKALKNVVDLPDDSSGITVALPNGTLINSLGSATTSATAPLSGIGNWLLPEGLEILAPRGGIQVALPVD